MDIDVIYTAKDGRQFNDPYKCEEYEKRLGPVPGTVARARFDLQSLGEDNYVLGLLKVRHDGVTKYYNYETRCMDDLLKYYVNVEDLAPEKRWLTNTIADVLYNLGQFSDDDLCEYEFIYGKRYPLGSDNTCYCTRTYNPTLWEEMEKNQNPA